MTVRCSRHHGACNALLCTGNEEPDDYAVRAKRRRRVTLWAAVTTDGVPVQNLWDFSLRRLDVLIADRAANGEGFHGERCVRMTLRFYDALLARHGLPPRSSEPGEIHTAEPGGR